MTPTSSLMTAVLSVLAFSVTAQAQVSAPLAAQIEDIEVAAASLPSTSLDLVNPGMFRQDSAAAANEMVEVGEAGGWVISAGPYIWLPARLEGTMSVAEAPLDVELTFKDIFDNFSVFAISGRAEAWKDNTWGVIFDGMYLTLDGDFGEPTTHTFNPTIAKTFTGPTGLNTIDILLAPEFDVTFDPNLNVDVRQGEFDLALGWRVCDKTISKTGEPWPSG